MIVCLNCRNQELDGALFCSECGAQLFDFKEIRTHPFNKSGSDAAADSNHPADTQRTGQNAGSRNSTAVEIVRLHLVDANRTISLGGKTEYTLGRVSTDQPVIPDVDLTEFEAYIQGVSRLHAALKIGRQRVSITDLGSANGTRVNGQKIVPHIDYPLKHGDAIALGKMIIQIAISAP